MPVGRIINLAPGEDGFFARLVRDFDIHVDDAGILPGVLFFDRDPVEDVGQRAAGQPEQEHRQRRESEDFLQQLRLGLVTLDGQVS